MRSLLKSSLIILLLLSAGAVSQCESTAVAVESVPATKLDPVSAACTSCHDGSNGPHARFCLVSQKGKKCEGHIVSVSYDELARRDEQLRPQSSLPPALVLYKGKITCVTCHGSDPHNRRPFAIDNRNSALCRACHKK